MRLPPQIPPGTVPILIVKRTYRRAPLPAPGGERRNAAGRALTSGRPQAQAHDRPAGGARGGGDLAVLRLGQAADDEQPDADAAEPAPVAGLALEEPVEDALVVAVGDADALVLHRDLDPVLGHPGPDVDGAAFGRVLEGVLEELADDDVGGHGVAAGLGEAGRDVGHYRVLVRQRPERGGGPVQDR